MPDRWLVVIAVLLAGLFPTPVGGRPQLLHRPGEALCLQGSRGGPRLAATLCDWGEALQQFEYDARAKAFTLHGKCLDVGRSNPRLAPCEFRQLAQTFHCNIRQCCTAHRPPRCVVPAAAAEGTPLPAHRTGLPWLLRSGLAGEGLGEFGDVLVWALGSLPVLALGAFGFLWARAGMRH
eukprot:EG_transcript_22455